MGFQLSPGINVSEVDLTTVVPSVLTTAGAYAGNFRWGPANVITLVDSEITLSKLFGTPDSNTAIPFFTCANFLSYGNNLKVVRAANTTSYNSDSNSANSNIQIQNEGVFQYTLLNSNNGYTYGSFMARYPGALGNSLAVETFDSSNTTLFNQWAYSGYFSSAPNTSSSVSAAGGSNDEFHLVVVDSKGLFTGTQGTVLETYPFISKALDATNANDGSTNYYKQVVFNNSKYIYAVDPVVANTTIYSQAVSTWGTNSQGTNFYRSNTSLEFVLSGGTDVAPGTPDIFSSYSLFQNKYTVDINLVLTGDHNTGVQEFVIDNIANRRADCVAFISPPASAVINQFGLEVSNIQTWLSQLARTSSYVVADSGWKYQFDVYNNTYRWVPLNADVAGLCVYTDSVTDPWYSPAGLNRGAIKNAVKLAWNPSQPARDTLYSSGVNPVISFPGQGIVLFGDKTLLNKPSAFDHINVRRLFIVLEKAISTAAKFSLFEFNDAFTQAQFVSLVTPFLRDIKGRRGITDFKVVCDSTNNTPQVVDSNQFVGDIYIKPARSINYIQLNFVAVGTGVDFSTIVGSNP